MNILGMVSEKAEKHKQCVIKLLCLQDQDKSGHHLSFVTIISSYFIF